MAWILGLAGGVLIGLGAVVAMATAGRIAGISGIAGGLTVPQRGDVFWRACFVVGLLAGAAAAGMLVPGHFAAPAVNGLGLAAAGVLVGFGSVLGNGCTSGHGVCGLARLSRRSLVAVAVFMATAIATVWGMHHGF